MESTADKHNRKLFRRLNDPHGGDKPVEHPMESLHPPTRNFKNISSNFTMPVTSWKPEEHNKMTYTRFWNLIREGAVDKVCGGAAAGECCAAWLHTCLVLLPMCWIQAGMHVTMPLRRPSTQTIGARSRSSSMSGPRAGCGGTRCPSRLTPTSMSTCSSMGALGNLIGDCCHCTQPCLLVFVVPDGRWCQG